MANEENEKYNIGDKFYFDNVIAADEWAESLNHLGYGTYTDYDMYKMNWIVTVIKAPKAAAD